MAKFIEVHKSGKAFLLNLDSICGVTYCRDSGACYILYPSDRCAEVDETYDQLREMIASAQGGIPLNTWRPDDCK